MNVRLLLFGFTLLLLAAVTLAFAGKEKEGLKRAEFAVQKLTCVACARNIDKALAAVPGIASTTVDVAAGRAAVVFAPDQVSAGTIAETISAAGYPAGLLRVVAAEAENVTASGGESRTSSGCACCNKQGG